MRTNAISRCSSLIAHAPAAGQCQYIRTILPASDSHFVYVEVAAAGHDGTVYHQTSGGYAPVLDSGDQPPPCSKVTAAGIPLSVWTDIVRQIQGGSVGEACYS
jgi:hypothetical protein